MMDCNVVIRPNIGCGEGAGEREKESISLVSACAPPGHQHINLHDTQWAILFLVFSTTTQRCMLDQHCCFLPSPSTHCWHRCAHGHCCSLTFQPTFLCMFLTRAWLPHDESMRQHPSTPVLKNQWIWKKHLQLFHWHLEWHVVGGWAHCVSTVLTIETYIASKKQLLNPTMHTAPHTVYLHICNIRHVSTNNSFIGNMPWFNILGMSNMNFNKAASLNCHVLE